MKITWIAAEAQMPPYRVLLLTHQCVFRLGSCRLPEGSSLSVPTHSTPAWLDTTPLATGATQPAPLHWTQQMLVQSHRVIRNKLLMGEYVTLLASFNQGQTISRPLSNTSVSRCLLRYKFTCTLGTQCNESAFRALRVCSKN